MLNSRYLPESRKCLSEFLLVKFTIAVSVHSSENSSKGTDTNTSTLLDLHLESCINFLDFDI